MEETISLKDIFQTLKKRIIMIIVITLLATAISAVVTYFFITPKYDASTQILVNQSSNDQAIYQNNQVQTNIQLINTYSVVVKSPVVLDQVIKDLNLNMTADQLSSLITVNSQQNSQVFTVTAEETSPAKATQIANAIADSFKTQIKRVMKVDNVSILSKAQAAAAQAPVKPKPTLNMAIAFVVGLMVSVGIAFLMEYLDNTIKDEEDIETLLGLPVLGAITEMGGVGQKKMSQLEAKAKVRSERVEA